MDVKLVLVFLYPMHFKAGNHGYGQLYSGKYNVHILMSTNYPSVVWNCI